MVGGLDRHDPRLDAVAARLDRIGVRIRPLAGDRWEQDLDRMHAVGCAAFAADVLHTPLARDAFHAMYRPVQMLLQPGLVLIAEQAVRPVGFVLALPDVHMARRGMPVDTLVVKALAVVPDRALAGLGRLLLERCQRAAHGLGMRRAIHALVPDGHPMRHLDPEARVLRRYALFARPVA